MNLNFSVLKVYEEWSQSNTITLSMLYGVWRELHLWDLWSVLAGKLLCCVGSNGIWHWSPRNQTRPECFTGRLHLSSPKLLHTHKRRIFNLSKLCQLYLTGSLQVVGRGYSNLKDWNGQWKGLNLILLRICWLDLLHATAKPVQISVLSNADALLCRFQSEFDADESITWSHAVLKKRKRMKLLLHYHQT